MALNETNQLDARGSLMSQQLDDKEIQEILKSGTGTSQHAIESYLKRDEN